MKRDGILLLGGGGFIGDALRRRLAADGRRTHIITRTPRSYTESNIHMHVGDLGDKGLLNELLAECNTVIHLASATRPGTSGRHPTLELENLTPMLQLLEVLENRLETRLIFLSSGGTVYGNPQSNPVAETSPFSPLSYHGAGKVAIEAFLNAYRTAGHAVTVLRPANAYGPGQKLNQGFGLVRTVLHHILNESTLEIWGDGESVRDFVYVDDVVSAIDAALHAPETRATYNVGSGAGHSLNEVLELTQKICGRPLRVQYRLARSMDVRKVVLDISHIASDLNWRPRVTLEEGIQKTWNWLENHA